MRDFLNLGLVIAQILFMMVLPAAMLIGVCLWWLIVPDSSMNAKFAVIATAMMLAALHLVVKVQRKRERPEMRLRAMIPRDGETIVDDLIITVRHHHTYPSGESFWEATAGPLSERGDTFADAVTNLAARFDHRELVLSWF